MITDFNSKIKRYNMITDRKNSVFSGKRINLYIQDPRQQKLLKEPKSASLFLFFEIVMMIRNYVI
jgi:hypothetical protein